MTSCDITVLQVSDGESWGRYVTDQLTKSPQVHHQTLVLDQLEYENPPEVTLACRQSAVVLILVTPQCLDFLQAKAGWLSKDLQQAPATSAIVLFLLLEENDSARFYEVAKTYASANWMCLDPGYGVQEVQQTIAKVLDIVENCQAARTQPPGAQREAMALRTAGNPEEERGATAEAPEAAGGVKTRTPPPPAGKKTHNLVQFFPSVIWERDVRVAMVFSEEVKGEVTVKVEQTEVQLKADRENDKVYTFVVPDLLPGKHNVLIMEGGKRRCRSSLQVRGAELGKFSSPYYLCQALGVANKHHLDLRLKDIFSASLPPPTCGLDTAFSHLTVTEQQQRQSEAEYPTLLHYAAANGLSEFCAALLESPGSSLAFHIHNCEGQDPAELAASGGFEELSNYIVDFMEMQTANDIYGHYISMHPRSDSGSDPEGDERPMTPPLLPRSQANSEPSVSAMTLPPLPLPAQPEAGTGAEGGEDPQAQDSIKLPWAGRMDRPPQPPPRKDHKGSSRSLSERRASPPHVLQAIRETDQKMCTMPAHTSLSSAAFMGMTHTGQHQPELAQGALGSRSQAELIELNEMVKAKEINLNEARMLLNAWHHRYGKNPSCSFKEKQKELSEIKAEYQKKRELLNKQDKPPKGFFSRLGLSRQAKQTIKLKISEPFQQRQQKRVPKVYTKSASTSQLLPSSADRTSNASTTSSSGSSRDSGWSQSSRDSHVSGSCDFDNEKEEVFERPGSLRVSSRDSTQRLSLGNLYLQQTERESTNPAATPPPSVPPHGNRLLLKPPSSNS